MSLSDEILTFIKKKGKVRPKDLETAFKVSDSTINRVLVELLAKKLVCKSGLKRAVIYEIGPAVSQVSITPLEINTNKGPLASPADSVAAGPNEAKLSLAARDDASGAQSAPIPKITSNAQDDLNKQTAGLCDDARVDLLTFWCGKLKVDRKSVADWHNGMYEFMFSNPYGMYAIPWGPAGKMVNILMWGLALGGVWSWGRGPSRRRIVVLLFIAALTGFYLYHQMHRWPFDRNELDQTKTELAQSQMVLDQTKQQLRSNQSELETTKEQLSSSQKALGEATGQLADSQSKLSAAREGAANDRRELARIKQQISESDSELAGVRSQLRQEQDKVKELEGRAKQLRNTPAMAQDVRPVDRQVTMDQIVVWTKQGVPGADIVNRIKQSGSRYALTRSDVDYLRKNLVSEEVIMAMLPAAGTADAPGQEGLMGKFKDFLSSKIQNW